MEELKTFSLQFKQIDLSNELINLSKEQKLLNANITIPQRYTRI